MVSGSDEIKTFVIFGPQRSGTSLISRLLFEAGVPIGDLFNNIVYEDQLAYDINNCTLQQAGGDYKNPPTKQDIKETCLNVLFAFYVWKRNFHRIWAFKVPTTTLLIDMYLPFIRNAHIIVTDRDITESRRSIMEQNNLTWEETAYVAEYHRRRDEFLKETNLPYIKIQFKDLIEKPKQTVAKLSKFTGIDLDYTIIDKKKPQFYAGKNKG